MKIILSLSEINIENFYFYRISMRDLKRLENMSRSPVFSFITATTQGLNTIRAFNKEQEFILK